MSRPTRRFRHRLSAALAVTALCLSLFLPGYTLAGERDRFSIAWSIYVGWMPWGYGEAEGIIDKWADKYGISIDVVQINDYIESINLYTAGRFDGVTLTNMDALTIPAAGGVDTTALIIGDFSSGNDGVVLKDSPDLKDIRGKRVHLVELSVSHYLLARALDSVGMSERDIRVVNTSDADIVAAFQTRGVQAAVTWNPQLGEIRRMPGAHVVFDSSRIPGEIIDMLGVNTAVLEANPNFGKALVGAWYEIMERMSGDDEVAREARAAMGDAAGTDLEAYEAQLASTTFFFDPAEAVDFITGPKLVETMDKVREFAFLHGLLGERAASADFVGIGFPDGSVLGSTENVKLRFDATYMRMAADGTL